MGQHFLIDQTAIARIVSAVNVQTEETLVEIGPGMGALTAPLLQKFGKQLHCIEVDKEAIAYLETNFPTITGQLHKANCLTFDYATLPGKRLVFVGNLPYNISSQILFMILAYREQVPCAVFMLQREVAYRLAAHKGTKENGILSILLQTFFKVELLFDLPPHAFDPPPKVHSSVVRITRNERKELPCDATLFERIVKGAFAQRRKMLRNSIEAAFGLSIDSLPQATLRPEALDVEDFIELTLLLVDRIGALDEADHSLLSQV
jgi:dimethyladenosine transferase